MRPLDPIDFEHRDAIPSSGWPFNPAELAPYYARAQRMLGLSVASPGIADWPAAGAQPWPLDPAAVRTTIDQFVHRRVLLKQHGRQLADAAAVNVLLRANALELELHSDGRGIQAAVLGCLDGRRHRVRATAFVLAGGGIENARLLLLSGDVSSGGIANRHGVVGRFFMDHIWAPLGTMELSDPALFSECALYDIRAVGTSLICGRLQLTEELMREEGLLNGLVAVTPRPPLHQEQAVQALRHLRWGGGGPSSSYVRSTLTALRSAPYVAALTGELAWRQRRFPPTVTSGWSSLRRGGRRLPGFDLELQLELPPRPENRVVLTNQRDALGMPAAGARYEFGALESRTFIRTMELVSEAILKSGLGRVASPSDRRVTSYAVSIHHHIGTTRMHESPTLGVVDPESRVHGIDNLYVVGSSVFPTGGAANPTLTILALALRLADCLAPAGSPPAELPAAGSPSGARTPALVSSVISGWRRR